MCYSIDAQNYRHRSNNEDDRKFTDKTAPKKGIPDYSCKEGESL